MSKRRSRLAAQRSLAVGRGVDAIFEQPPPPPLAPPDDAVVRRAWRSPKHLRAALLQGRLHGSDAVFEQPPLFVPPDDGLLVVWRQRRSKPNLHGAVLNLANGREAVAIFAPPPTGVGLGLQRIGIVGMGISV